MKSLILIVFVLIIGFIIGSFTGYGESLFSFLNKPRSRDAIEENLTQKVKDSINRITVSAQKETGAIFDKQYLDAMITMYEGSVALSKIGTIAGGHPELRTVAKTVSKEDAEVLVKLKKWRAEWYPEEKISETPTIKPTFVK